MDREARLEGLNAEAKKLQPAVNRAAEANAVMTNEMVVEAFDAIEAGLNAAIRTSTLDQTAVREDSYKMLRLLDSLKGHLTTHIRKGEIAAKGLADIKDKRKFIMDFGAITGRKADR